MSSEKDEEGILLVIFLCWSSVGDVTGNVCDLVFNYFLYVLSVDL